MVFYGNAAHVNKATGMVNKDIFTYLNEPTKICVERSEDGCAFF
jgi:hypothetical protein